MTYRNRQEMLERNLLPTMFPIESFDFEVTVVVV